jgi:hypothetical protein
MKRIVPAIALAGALAASAFSRTNVLPNGSFEAFDPNTLIPTGWTSFTMAEVSSNFANHGSWSALADFANGSFVGMFLDTASVTEGVRIVQRCLVLHPSGDPLPTGGSPPPTAGIKLEFFPPEGIEVPPPEENLAFDANSPVDVWEQVSLSTVVPADINIARIVVISFELIDPNDPNGNPLDPNNGPVYADLVTASLDSGANALANPSFEASLGGTWNTFGSGGSGAIRNLFEVPAQDGTAVLKIGGPFTAGATQEIAVSPGQTLDISAFFRSRSDGTPPLGGPYQSPAAFAGVKIEWVAGSVPSPNIDIAANDNPISATTNIITGDDPTDTWIPVTIDYTMPAGMAALLRATLINGFGTGSGQAYFDNYEMVLTNVFDGSDYDNDGDEDMVEIAKLQQTFTGDGGGLDFGGLVFDHDEDEDVDDSDSTFTLVRMTGPAAP